MQNYSSKFKVLLRVLFISLIFHFSLFTFHLGKVQASALSLNVDPPIIVINALPPANVTSSLSIQNKSDMQITLQIQLKSFKAKGENGELEYLEKTSTIFKYIQVLDAGVPVENITLEPKQEKKLDLNINIPQDTTISDHYFSIIFISKNTPSVESNSSVNQIGIATNVLLSIGSPEAPKAVLEEFSSNIFFEKGPVPFTVRVKNTGTHFIKPRGEIAIKNMFGQNIGKLDLIAINVLSDSIRAIPDRSSSGPEGTSSTFRNPVALWKENFLLGFYTATINISFSDNEPAFIRSIQFFAFPFQGIIAIVVAAIAVIIIKNKLKTHIKSSKKSE